VLVELREGWVAVRERAWVWATVLAFSFALLVALTPFFVLGAADRRGGLRQRRGLRPRPTRPGASARSAARCWGRAGSRCGPLRAAVWGAVPWPLALALFALGPPVAVVYAAMVVAGIGLGLFIVGWETALAQRIPPHLLSRVSAWDWMGSLALVPLGYLLAGPAAEAFGASRVLAVGGLVGSAALLLALLPRETRELTRYEAPPSVPAAVPAG
jgi:hypothetical protein